MTLSIDVMNEKRAYVTRPPSPTPYYSSVNLYIDIGADKDNLFGGKDKIEYIHQEPGFEGGLKMAELAARTCYKSENLIKEGSADRIVFDVCS